MNFSSVLVANRGEIALRIMKTCRDMGFSTVAVYSEADADAPHVQFADRAVCLGAAAASESYLNIAKIIAAARLTGAGAIHPGYGFLAENAGFAEAVNDAGLVFVGPTVEAIVAMGDKAHARALMSERGVPVAPGYSGDDQSDVRLIAEADRIGFPVLVKAVAGGGGKGMSIVRDAVGLPAALATARRVARSAFGNDVLLLETYVDSPRHIEVQILGDMHGAVIHCFERECSIQRRFQKVIEEAPSVAVDTALRTALCSAAVNAGQALGYVGAGTVEFILAPSGQFYFLEVNTRLQVEHPVTEMITGLDLVAWQLRVAAGERLPPQSAIQRTGHAVEARIYAEDPENDFLPATGTLVAWRLPELDGLRVDSGVSAGNCVGIDYDPMLAKVIAWAPERSLAIRRLAYALSKAHIAGVRTNREFLMDVLQHPTFESGAVSTHFIPEHMNGWTQMTHATEMNRAVLAAALWRAETRVAARTTLRGVRPGWRNNSGAPITDYWDIRDETIELAYGLHRDGFYEVLVDGGMWVAVVQKIGPSTIGLVLTAPGDDFGVNEAFGIYPDGHSLHVVFSSGTYCVKEADRFPQADVEEEAAGCVAPMPGRVIQVHVNLGDEVEAGQPLVVLEAMKMEQVLTAARPGIVSQLNCQEGDVVEAGTILVQVEEVESGAE